MFTPGQIRRVKIPAAAGRPSSPSQPAACDVILLEKTEIPGSRGPKLFSRARRIWRLLFGGVFVCSRAAGLLWTTEGLLPQGQELGAASNRHHRQREVFCPERERERQVHETADERKSQPAALLWTGQAVVLSLFSTFDSSKLNDRFSLLDLVFLTREGYPPRAAGPVVFATNRSREQKIKIINKLLFQGLFSKSYTCDGSPREPLEPAPNTCPPNHLQHPFYVCLHTRWRRSKFLASFAPAPQFAVGCEHAAIAGRPADQTSFSRLFHPARGCRRRRGFRGSGER